MRHETVMPFEPTLHCWVFGRGRVGHHHMQLDLPVKRRTQAPQEVQKLLMAPKPTFGTSQRGGFALSKKHDSILLRFKAAVACDFCSLPRLGESGAGRSNVRLDVVHE